MNEQRANERWKTKLGFIILKRTVYSFSSYLSKLSKLTPITLYKEWISVNYYEL